MVWEGRWLPFPRSETSPCLWGSLLVADKQNPNHHGKDMVSTNPVVSSFLARAFVPNLCDNTEFQFTATTVASMATKSSDLDDWMSGAKLQTEGHTPILSRGQMDPEETGASGSAPSYLPSWSLARKPLPSHPNTRHCLGIHVALTKETGATPLPPHAWMAPLVEDMLCHGRTGLTEAVVMGPDWDVLFYGRQSLGEGLNLGEVRDTMFTTYRSRHLGW